MAVAAPDDAWFEALVVRLAVELAQPDLRHRAHHRLGGGDTAQVFRLLCAATPADAHWLVKVMPEPQLDALTGELAGLAALARTQAVRVPAPVCAGVWGQYAYMVLEWIDLKPLDRPGAVRLGQAMARLHAVEGPAFGYRRDNHLGANPQLNGWCDDWTEFFVRRRLAPQLRMAATQLAGDGGEKGEALIERVPGLLAGHRPAPSLLHGDLWSGNVGVTPSGEPVVFDPAVHFGDRECDLAMAALFGGFDPEFFSAYETLHPLPPGHLHRRDLYQLYHLLNHLNLFGRPYRAPVLRCMERLLAA
ncbi:MAG: fructosamine kinase family protein [Pseudomonadota bacterium]|nr:fructosamine kinase family protein [Pseudomonadota bacterium]